MKETGCTERRRTQAISAIQRGIEPCARDSDLTFSLDAILQTVFASMKNPCGSVRGQRQTFFLSMMKVECGWHAGSSLRDARGSSDLLTIRIGHFTAEP